MSGEVMQLRGQLLGHGGWVTQIAINPAFPEMLISSSRDKTIIMWQLYKKDGNYGFPSRRLTGHSHFVSDVVVSSCGQFAVSASWDKTLRLWDLEKATCVKRFEDHKSDVLSVAFSADNRQIISCGRDKTIKLWNTLGELKWTQGDQKTSHNEWVSTVRFSPSAQNPVIVSGGWDKIIKVWHLNNFQLKTSFTGHTGYINTVTVSPDGSLAASGGQDGNAFLWDLGTSENTPLHTLEGKDEISMLIFSPNRYWLCAACGSAIKIWDLEEKKIVFDQEVEAVEKDFTNVNSDKPRKEPSKPKVLSLCWTSDGQTLFAGYNDNIIRVFELTAVSDQQM